MLLKISFEITISRNVHEGFLFFGVTCGIIKAFWKTFSYFVCCASFARYFLVGLCADVPAVLHSSLYFINPFVIHPLLSLIITNDKRGHNCSINYSLFGVRIVILSAIISCTLS